MKAAERELAGRVKRHGSLKEQPLTPDVREHYAVQWADIQEQFVGSPQKAVAEADALLTARPARPGRHRPRSPGSRGHAPWMPDRRHANGSSQS
ncbi:hypothetical protein GCM10010252_18170 [Streptomyces aureoverticillatus]|nr:hypothetical protein GCM10010252_18170 [Streptomyces aureoverticillatus]